MTCACIAGLQRPRARVCRTRWRRALSGGHARVSRDAEGVLASSCRPKALQYVTPNHPRRVTDLEGLPPRPEPSALLSPKPVLAKYAYQAPPPVIVRQRALPATPRRPVRAGACPRNHSVAPRLTSTSHHGTDPGHADDAEARGHSRCLPRPCARRAAQRCWRRHASAQRRCGGRPLQASGNGLSRPQLSPGRCSLNTSCTHLALGTESARTEPQ